MPAGSSRAVRLDPLALPVRFAAIDAAADERMRWIELDRERVVLRRAVRGIPMAIKVPVNDSIFLRRARPPRNGEPPVHRGEREIIARE